MKDQKPSPENMLRRESGQMAADIRWMLAAGVGVAFASALSLVFVPRLLGTAGYGAWLSYRSVVLLLALISSLGSAQTAGRFFSAHMAEHRELEAWRLFKVVGGTRLLGGLLAGAIASLLFVARPSGSALDQTALCAGLSVILLNVGSTSLLVHFAQRRRRTLSVMATLPALLNPVVLLAGFAWQGLGSLPRAALAGDAIFALLSLASAAPWFRWVAGWPPRHEWREIMTFMGLTSMAGLAMSSFSNLFLVLLFWMGLDQHRLGLIGLGLRLTEGLGRLISPISGALMPSLMVAVKLSGESKAAQWQGMVLRWGALFIILTGGAWFILSPALVPAVWGPSFSEAVQPVGLCLLSMLGLWIGAQIGQWDMLMGRPARFALHVLMLFVITALALLPGHEAPVNALLISTLAFAGLSWMRLPRRLSLHTDVLRIAAPALTLPVLAIGFPTHASLWAQGLAGVLWLVVVSALAMALGLVRRGEWEKILRRRTARADSDSPVVPEGSVV